jgi:subtilisin family serine protease
MISEKVHPYLPGALEENRTQILLAQVEVALRLEIADERVEEREYDEQQRLRKQRFIDRKVVRGETLKRYAVLARQFQRETARVDLSRQLDADLRSLAAEDVVKADLGKAIRSYDSVVPAEFWPPVLCMAESILGARELNSRLASLGLLPLPAEPLGRFGILKFRCPPEMPVVREIAAMPSVHSLALPATPVRSPAPQQAATQGCDLRRILQITPEMTASGGDGVVIAVLDTGLDLSHPAFARLTPEDYRNFTGSQDEDTEGHGTHVASVAGGDESFMGGAYSGIAPRCRLVVGKVMSEYSGSLEEILNGMAWAVFEKRADILILSLGDSETPPNGCSIWSRACEEAFRHGTVVCVAAGNVELSCPGTITVPADGRFALAVGAVDERCQLAPFSAKGSMDPASPLFGKPDCVAPGVGIVAARSSLSTYPALGGDSFHTPLSGTSAAAPAIAGCLALIKSAARAWGWEMSPREVLDLFYSACQPVRDVSGETYRADFEIGHGLVDMRRVFDVLGQRLSTYAAPGGVAARMSESAGEPAPVLTGSSRFEADVCYLCGKRYQTKEGSFSPAWKCERCGAPVCAVCWQIGRRRCHTHHAMEPAAEAASPCPPRVTAPKEERTIPPAIDQQCCEEFLNGFEFKVQQRGRFQNPNSKEELKINPKQLPQNFNCPFGRVRQFVFKTGFPKKTARLVLAAITLDAGGLRAADGGYAPIPDLLRQVAGQRGLDITAEVFYVVGIFSPVGWPAEWRRAQGRGNAIFYFINRGDEGGWEIRGADGPFRPLFDPELPEEKVERARQTLGSHTDLMLPGGQAPLDALLEEFHLDRGSIQAAVQASAGRYRIIDHKGRSAVQRTTI